MKQKYFSSRREQNFPLFVLFCLLFLLLPLFSACDGHQEGEPISEIRREIYLVQSDGLTLCANFGEREYPYAADGKAEPLTPYGEIYLTVPDNGADYRIAFPIAGKTYGGEMSFDSVTRRYFFSQSLPTPTDAELVFTIDDGEAKHTLRAKRIRTGEELSPESAVERLKEQRAEQWQSQEIGELYVRLTHRTDNYYFIAVIGKTGKIDSFLLHAITGEIVAERKNG